MEDQNIVNKVKEYVGKIYRERSDSGTTYHNLTHTAEVAKVVGEIADASSISDEETEVLVIAAWFHDIGYIERCEGHEDVSIKIARDFLSNNNYPSQKIEIVVSLISATRMPHNPQSRLQEIICDADLHHIGTSDCDNRGEDLRNEIQKTHGITFSDEGWLEKNLKFFNMHKFYTPYAKSRFETQKNINYLKIKKKLEKLKKKKEEMSESQAAETEIQKNGKETEAVSKKDKKQKNDDKGAGRSIETMFRNTVRTHVDFSSMADTKANIMISVSTLVLTIIVSIMIRKLDANPHLVIPTAMLTLTCLFTLVYAILVTRPKVTSGTFTEEDIRNKKANLLFFGNFHKMSVNDFCWGMNEMIKDKDYLYDSMIKDFYYLGQVLGQKYKRLRISYTIFMYGVIISVIAFAIAFITSPEATNLGPLID